MFLIPSFLDYARTYVTLFVFIYLEQLVWHHKRMLIPTRIHYKIDQRSNTLAPGLIIGKYVSITALLRRCIVIPHNEAWECLEPRRIGGELEDDDSATVMNSREELVFVVTAKHLTDFHLGFQYV